jgi:hypothetical protein
VLDALTPLAQGSPSAPRLHVQFGAYATFLSFFGLADLPAHDPVRFRRVVDYASSMAWELYRDDLGDVRVRFLFADGGDVARVGLRAAPLFGREAVSLPWADFERGMARFAVRDRKAWCEACGETAGVCALYGGSATGSSSAGGKDTNGITTVVAGVIGALVAVVVVLGLLSLVMFFTGVKLVKKSVLKNMIPVEKLDDA